MAAQAINLPVTMMFAGEDLQRFALLESQVQHPFRQRTTQAG